MDVMQSLQGIVIKTIDYSESSKIIRLFTAEQGKISLIARGVRKIKSKQSAVTQLFTLGEFTFFKLPSKIGTLHQGEVTHSYQALRDDLIKTSYAAYLAEMIERLMNEDEASSHIFTQFEAALRAIESGKDPAVVIHIFELLMLKFQGYLPQFEHCTGCLQCNPLISFSATMGGMLCNRCISLDRHAFPIATHTLRLLKLLIEMDIRRLGETQLKLSTKQELKKCMRTYMDLHIDVRWKSRDFIDQMEKYLIDPQN
jgi:DNA repair protein RecO (recombination protein O)